MLLDVHRDHIRTIKDGQPRSSAASVFTQLLSSDKRLVHRDREDYY